MPRYDRSYDNGPRGWRERPAFGPPNRFRPSRYGYDYDVAGGGRGRRLPNRVTARYNMDYVAGNRGDRYPRNYNTFGGDRIDRIGDLRYYRQPYTTIGGTRTWRGASRPFGYDTEFVAGYDRDYQGG